MKIIKKTDEELFELKTTELNLEGISILKNELALKILNFLKNEQTYPKKIAEKLKIHEQKIYYYIKKLEKSKLIKIIDQKNIQGSTANIYDITSDSFFIKIKNFQKRKTDYNTYLDFSPFIENGKMNSIIIVGSPDSHGKIKARAKDGHTAIELALFLGKYVDELTQDVVKLDTEITPDEIKNNNLIIIGGPNVNTVFDKINDKLKINFSREHRGIYSKITNKNYFEDEIGIVGKIKSPFNENKQILFFAGNRQNGTKSSVLFFTRNYHKFKENNIFDKKTQIKIVEGIDMNSDSIIDEVEILE